jgi:hypothetical protein
VIVGGASLAVVAALAAVGLVIWIGAPLRRGAAVEDADPVVLALLVEREAALGNLRDLEADFAAGRVAPDDFARQRAALVARGARLMTALDQAAHPVDAP